MTITIVVTLHQSLMHVLVGSSEDVMKIYQEQDMAAHLFHHVNTHFPH